MTGSKPTPAELLRMCDAEIAVHEQCEGCDQYAIARALKEHLSAPPAVGRDEVIEELISVINGKRMITNVIGPLYGAGWNSAVKHIVETLIALKASTSPP